mmetsp:Transcript_34740/g.75952  ORF Transcript_34740/g.75952 Transcript_34740/m.75952 type:complete len:547 (-) Transcript_34740:856-2496(-)
MAHPTQLAPLVGRNLASRQTTNGPSRILASHRFTTLRAHNVRFGRSSVSAKDRSAVPGTSAGLGLRTLLPVLSRNRVHQPQKRCVLHPNTKPTLRRGHLSITAASFTTTEETIDKPTVVLPEEVVQEATTGWQRRYVMIGLCFLAFLLCNMDRVNMSIAIIDMKDEFQWDSSTMGVVQSSFFWGYLLTQILGGVLADRVGGKTVLGFGVIWWSLATAVTPLAAKDGLTTLLAARACMGIGEGVAMPAMNSMLSRWVPSMERSRSLSLVYSGMYTGSIMGLAFSPHIIDWFDWPSVFYIFGSLGTVWFGYWVSTAASTPLEDPKITAAERDYIVANTVERGPATSIPWKEIMTSRAVWAIIVCHFCHNWGTFILLTWMPTYYNQVLGMNMQESGFYSVLPWITMALTANVGGFAADKLVEGGMPTIRVRKVMQTVGFMGPAFFLTQLANINSPGAAVACMCASQGLDAFSQSGLYSNHQDIGPKYSGVLLGISNTAGVLAGVMGTYATGRILENGTWDDVWAVAVAFYLMGTLVWNMFATSERQSWG